MQKFVLKFNWSAKYYVIKGGVSRILWMLTGGRGSKINQIWLT